MNPAVVVDIGNSRVKWARCEDGRVAHTVSLPHDDEAAWRTHLDAWHLGAGSVWILASVQPQACACLAAWLRQQGQVVRVLEDCRQLPLRVLLERPDCVGMDRLLDAVAANRRRPAGVPAVIVDAGSAVTVDWLDATGAFGGGAIFPGLRLMARALHDYTALLPLIAVTQPCPPLPGRSTPAAMETGIFWAVAGGIRALTAELARRSGSSPVVFLTGGDTACLAPALPPEVIVWPEMTLEGIRLTAETLP